MHLPFDILAHIVSFVNDVRTFQTCLGLSKSLLHFFMSEAYDTIAASVTFPLRDSSFFTKPQTGTGAGATPGSDIPTVLRLHYVQRLVIPDRLVIATEPEVTIREAFPNLRSFQLLNGCGGVSAHVTSVFKNISSHPMEQLHLWFRCWGDSMDSDTLLQEGMLYPFASTIRSLSFSYLGGRKLNESVLPPKLKKLHLCKTAFPDSTGEQQETQGPFLWRNSLTHLYVEYDSVLQDPEFVKSFPNLEVVVFGNCDNIIDHNFFGGLQAAANLRKCEIVRCGRLDSSSEELVVEAIGGRERLSEIEFSFVPIRRRMKKGEMKAPGPNMDLPEFPVRLGGDE